MTTVLVLLLTLLAPTAPFGVSGLADSPSNISGGSPTVAPVNPANISGGYPT